MKTKTIQNESSDSEVFEKTGTGEHKHYPSFHLEVSPIVGMMKTVCNSCQSDDIETRYFPTGRRVRCLECGTKEWD